jgi:hypothetical protein
MFGFAIALGAFVVALGGNHSAGWFLLNLALLDLMLWATTIPHEAGHAIASRLVGLDVVRIVLGTGKRLRTIVVRGVPVDLHALPIGGVTYTYLRDERAARFKQILVVAAGPAVEAILLWAALYFGGDAAATERWQRGPAPVTALIIACVLGLIVNLLPLRARTHAGVATNDGAKLLWLLCTRRIPFDRIAHMTAVQRAQLLIVHGQDVAAETFARSALEEYPNDPYLMVGLSAAVLNQHCYVEGRELLLKILGLPQLEGKVEAVASNNLAWADLHIPDASLIEKHGRGVRLQID